MERQARRSEGSPHPAFALSATPHYCRARCAPAGTMRIALAENAFGGGIVVKGGMVA
jgi:hypothetical protein